MRDDRPDCGCAPTPAERRAFAKPVSRRAALGIGLAAVLGLGTVNHLTGSSAFAADYPSWDDVERAMANEQAKAGEITRIEGLIADLTADVARKQAEAERLMREYIVAQEAFEDAVDRAASLQAQADAEAEKARIAAEKLGKLAAQQYRTAGDDPSLELFFSSSAATADDLLARLGTMDKIVEANRSVHTDAVSARDNAQNLSNQAAVARDERDRLQREAQSKMEAAQAAAQQAQAALDEQTANLGVLEAQLAALKDTTAKTVADYEAGVEAARQAELERQRREEEERQRRIREAQANQGSGSSGGVSGSPSGSGGGSGGSGGSGSGTGWVRPHSGYISSWFGNRGEICSGGYCSGSGHRGIDFADGCWSPIYAASAGRVVHAAWSGSWGNYIKVDHGGGIVTGYAHLPDGGYNVSWGDWVEAGQVIGYAGNTGASSGCHLHFEVYSDGYRIDPAPYLRNRGVSV